MQTVPIPHGLEQILRVSKSGILRHIGSAFSEEKWLRTEEKQFFQSKAEPLHERRRTVTIPFDIDNLLEFTDPNDTERVN